MDGPAVAGVPTPFGVGASAAAVYLLVKRRLGGSTSCGVCPPAGRTGAALLAGWGLQRGAIGVWGHADGICTDMREFAMSLGRVSALAMLASGVAGLGMPYRVGDALHLSPIDSRGTSEVRAGLGGTYAALGGMALVSRSATVRRAVGVTWLGAAAARLAALRLDEPDTDATYWAYLAAEVGLGLGAILQPR